MDQHVDNGSEMDQLRREIRALRRRLHATVAAVAAVALAGAAAGTQLKGDLSVSGLLKCAGLTADGPVELAKGVSVKGDITASGTLSGTNITDMAQTVKNLGTKVDSLEDRTRNLIRVEVVTVEPNNLVRKDGIFWGPLKGTRRIDTVGNLDWKLLTVFPTIENPGYLKNVKAEIHGNYWAAGATAVYQCDVVEAEKSFVLNYDGRWYDWDETKHPVRVRFIAIFVRR